MTYMAGHEVRRDRGRISTPSMTPHEAAVDTAANCCQCSVGSLSSGRGTGYTPSQRQRMKNKHTRSHPGLTRMVWGGAGAGETHVQGKRVGLPYFFFLKVAEIKFQSFQL